MGRPPVWQAPSVLGCARASGAGLEAAATTAKRYNFVNTCNYLLSWRCACSGKVRSSGRVMQQHSCSRSQRASSTSFCASCSARRASPPSAQGQWASVLERRDALHRVSRPRRAFEAAEEYVSPSAPAPNTLSKPTASHFRCCAPSRCPRNAMTADNYMY